jgi:hypothetical protein
VDKTQLGEAQARGFAAYLILQGANGSVKSNQTILACRVVTMLTSKMKDFPMISESGIRKTLTLLTPKVQSSNKASLKAFDKSTTIDFELFKECCKQIQVGFTPQEAEIMFVHLVR